MQAITGSHKGLIESMRAAGILPPHTRRVVIDIGVDDPVMLYYETFADERLIEIDFASQLGAVIKQTDSMAEAMAKVDEDKD